MENLELKPKLQDLLRFVQDYREKNGFSPSYEEMMEATAASSKSMVSYYIKELERDDWIKRTPNIPRSIQVLRALPDNITGEQRRNSFATTRLIPLLGDIAAGKPIEVSTEENRLDPYMEGIEVEESKLAKKYKNRNLFALNVKGNSMIDAGIYDGDVIILDPVSSVDNGDMAVIWFPKKTETTLKYFYLEKDQIRLKPANPTMKPKNYGLDEVEIQGRVVMMIRSYG